MDKPSLLLMPEEYDRKLVFGDNKLGLSLLGDISYFYFSKPSLLAKVVILSNMCSKFMI